MTESNPGVDRRVVAWPALPPTTPIGNDDRYAPLPVPTPILRQGLAPHNTAFRVQPVHGLQDGALLGAEILAGSPVGILQRSKTAVGSGESGQAALMHLACLEGRLWGALTGRPGALTTTMRMPASTAYGPALVADLARALDRSGLPAHQVEISLDPRHLPGDGVTTLMTLSALRHLGVGLALDSAHDMPLLRRLLHLFPFTCLRLHGRMTAYLDDSRDARQALTGMAFAAHDQNMVVVATDVRTSLQRDILADLGCDAAQGPLFGLPMEASLFRAALACVWSL